MKNTGGFLVVVLAMMLGLPVAVSGSLMSGSYNNAFSGGGFSSTFTRNGKAVSENYSAKGDLLGRSGYGEPDQTWSTPAIAKKGVI